MPVDVGWRRGGRLARGERAQVAGSGVRLLAVLRSRRRASRTRDVDQSELPAVGRGRAGKKFAGLGASAGASFSRVEVVASDSRTGSFRVASAPSQRS